MGLYATETQVPVERSKAEIEKILERYGATNFFTGWQADKALVAFTMKGRQVRFVLPLPNRNADEFRRHSSRSAYSATKEVQEQRYQQALRSRWRSLALAIKAKLEIVETGITSFEREFLANIALPDGQVVGDWIAPQLESAYSGGHMPPLLSYGGPQ